jgi:polysaccharide chain length determinant protein (PEP-CTERM system associated)
MTRALTEITVAQLVGVFLRRKRWIAVPAVLGVVGALVAYQLLPPVYRSSTLIMAEPQKVPTDYVKATVTTNLQERLKSIEQQITNRENLARVIRELDLYADLRREQGMGAAVQQARRDLNIQVLGQTVLRIIIRGAEPEQVARTANRLAELFIADNLQVREQQAETTSTFLESELGEMRRRLEEQEARIAEFKLAHIGQLPEQRDTNLASAGGLQQRLRGIEDQLAQAQTQRAILASQATSVVTTTTGGVDPLDQLRLELATLRSQYTDSHPDVIRTQQAIEQLERARAVTGTPSPTQTRVTNPAIQAQIDAIDVQLARLRAQREQVLADMGSVQARLENIPRVEQQLLSLTRDYENVKESYDSLLAKRLEARLAENLEKRRQSAQFTVLERALPPGEPFAPNLKLLLAIGVGGGLLTGLGLAFLREHTDQTYSNVDSFRTDFPGVPVLAAIPVLQPARGSRGGRKA